MAARRTLVVAQAMCCTDVSGLGEGEGGLARGVAL